MQDVYASQIAQALRNIESYLSQIAQALQAMKNK